MVLALTKKGKRNVTIIILCLLLKMCLSFTKTLMNPAVQHSCFTNIDLEDTVVVTKGSIKFFLTVAPLQASSWLALLVKVFAREFVSAIHEQNRDQWGPKRITPRKDARSPSSGATALQGAVKPFVTAHLLYLQSFLMIRTVSDGINPSFSLIEKWRGISSACPTLGIILSINNKTNGNQWDLKRSIRNQSNTWNLLLCLLSAFVLPVNYW